MDPAHDVQHELFKTVKLSGSPLDKYKVLVLNADFRPMFYSPLSTAHWQQVMFLYVKGLTTGLPRFTIVEYYPDVFVHHGRDGAKIQLPSVIAHLKYRPPPKTLPMTKYNVYLRDGFTCQYSGQQLPTQNLSWDHIVPTSRGGKTSWENIVSAEQKVNELKDSMSLKEFERIHEYKLRAMPTEPTWGELYNQGRKHPPSYLHDSWKEYLQWEIT
jgi:5-methylcytosine-specific restriction endonuclease McrA